MYYLGFVLSLALVIGVGILLWFRTPNGKKWLANLWQNQRKDKNMAKKKTTKATDILGVLRAKKEQDGKLSKFGEWVLSGQSTGWVLEDKKR